MKSIKRIIHVSRKPFHLHFELFDSGSLLLLNTRPSKPRMSYTVLRTFKKYFYQGLRDTFLLLNLNKVWLHAI